MFNSIIGESITVTTFGICIISALILGIIVSLVHRVTTRTNKNFVITLATLPSLVAMVILLVNGNLGTSVAVLGAFSLIRFRSIPGNSKEILSVFFSMAIGLAIGCGYIGFAVLFTIFISLILYILSTSNFASDDTLEKQLKIIIPEDMDYTNCFNDIFDNNLNSYTLEKAKTTNMGSLFELTYRIKLKKDTNEKKFIDNIRVINGNLKIMISNSFEKEEL